MHLCTCKCLRVCARRWWMYACVHAGVHVCKCACLHIYVYVEVRISVFVCECLCVGECVCEGACVSVFLCAWAWGVCVGECVQCLYVWVFIWVRVRAWVCYFFTWWYHIVNNLSSPIGLINFSRKLCCANS